MKIRLDELLVLKKLASNRSRAKQLIQNGSVVVGGEVAKKVGQPIDEQTIIELLEGETYVSRGALKLEEAIQAFKVEVEKKVVADIGASTGGFTDYLLQNGASLVYAIDVGHGQLAEKLRKDKRVINMEGINIRNSIKLPQLVDFAVVDLSYISLTLTLPSIAELVKPKGQIITLIKPQFEAGPKVVGKDGVIKDPKVVKSILENLKSWCQKNNLPLKKVIPSPITGKEGNKEFLGIIEL